MKDESKTVYDDLLREAKGFVDRETFGIDADCISKPGALVQRLVMAFEATAQKEIVKEQRQTVLLDVQPSTDPRNEGGTEVRMRPLPSRDDLKPVLYETFAESRPTVRGHAIKPQSEWDAWGKMADAVLAVIEAKR
jgi:hypothetical protein